MYRLHASEDFQVDTDANQLSSEGLSHRNTSTGANPGMPSEVSASNLSEEPSMENFVGFLQKINFSVPPPFMPQLTHSCYVPFVPNNYNQVGHSVSPNPISSMNSFVNENKSIPSNFVQNELSQSDEAFANVKKEDSRPAVRLCDVCDQLKLYFIRLNKMKDDIKNLDSISNELDGDSWNDAVNDISSQQAALLKLKETINDDPSNLLFLKCKIKKRLKKRKAIKKKKDAKDKSFSKYEVARLHMQQLQQIANKEKQEEKLKAEADSVLYSVRQKKCEANNQLQFLFALSKLHAARLNVMKAENKHVALDSVVGFKKILEKLTSMWERQIKDYSVEENGLKLMLKDMVSSVENEECANLKKIFGHWMKCIFGTADCQKNSYFSAYNEFVEIRRQWDKYVVNDRTNSSKIPSGWIIPKYREDDVWAKLIF